MPSIAYKDHMFKKKKKRKNLETHHSDTLCSVQGPHVIGQVFDINYKGKENLFRKNQHFCFYLRIGTSNDVLQSIKFQRADDKWVPFCSLVITVLF